MTAPATQTISEIRDRQSSRKTWRLALLLSVTALMSAVLLTGTSVWFLGAVALAGAGPAAFAFNFHIPAALVRLFAMSRTATKYGERVVGHRAALMDQVSRRSRMLLAMAAAPAVRSAGWQLARQDRLNDYIDDVEDVDYARLRIGLPLAGLAIGAALLSLLTLIVVPLAMLPVCFLAAASAVAYRRYLPLLRHDWRAARELQRAASMRFGKVVSSVIPLKAEGLWAIGLDQGFDRLGRAEERQRRFRDRLAGMEAVARMAGPFSALSVLLAAWEAGLAGNGLLPAVFVAFGWLALGESAAGLSRVVAGHVRKGAADAGLRKWQASQYSLESVPTAATRGVETITIAHLPRTAPDGRPLGGVIDATFRKGWSTALRGASGCGKTTLLKQIAGWLPNDRAGRITVDGSDADRHSLCHLGLHDAAVLADTVRENLFAPGMDDAACWAALEGVELDQRIREAGGLDAWITQDRLSLGEAQRLNLARAWLSEAPIVLLDEPTEHVDAAQADRILKRLVERFSDRILIYSTHRQAGAGSMDTAVIELR